MACFLVPAAEAAAAAIATKAVSVKETNSAEIKTGIEADPFAAAAKAPFLRKLKWLTNMLWGGSALLAFEHIWHGEVVPWFPFLTAASDPAEAAVMLHEMATVGTSMALLITAVWGVMLFVTNAMEKQVLQTTSAVN